MSFLYISGLMSFLALFMVSRFLNEKALKTLDPEAKVKLIDGFSNMRKYSLFPIILLIALFFIINKLVPHLYMITFIGYFVSLAVFIGITSVLTYKKLQSLALPLDYIKKTILARTLLYLGIIVFFTTMLLDTFFRK